MLPLLILQFLLGMFANLFVTFSSSTDPNPLAVVFTGGSPVLILHVIVAVVLFILALVVLVTATFIHRRPVIAIASAGFASSLWPSSPASPSSTQDTQTIRYRT